MKDFKNINSQLRDWTNKDLKKNNFFKIIVSYFFFEIDNIQIRIPDLDPDPNPN